MNGATKFPAVDADAFVSVTMRRRELDYVLQVLAMRPYAEVSGLIDSLAKSAAGLPVESIVPGAPKQ